MSSILIILLTISLSLNFTPQSIVNLKAQEINCKDLIWNKYIPRNKSEIKTEEIDATHEVAKEMDINIIIIFKDDLTPEQTRDNIRNKNQLVYKCFKELHGENWKNDFIRKLNEKLK